MAGKRGILDYEFSKEGDERVLRFNCESAPFFPSLEDNGTVMAAVIDALSENLSATRIVLQQKRDYEYDYGQTSLLASIAKLKRELSRQHMFMLDKTSPTLYVKLKNIFYHKLKADPVAAYYELAALRNQQSSRKDKASSRTAVFLSKLLRLFESTQFIEAARRHSYRYGERSIYRSLFSPAIKPDFMFTRLMANYPAGAEEIDSYRNHDTEVSVFKLPDAVQKMYHINPPEFRLSEDKYELLDEARGIITEHKPERSEFIDPERMRSVFYNVGNDLIDELASNRGISIRSREVDELTSILVRYTVGFGLVEVLLQDSRVQDITINSPMGNMPAFIVHQGPRRLHDEHHTNIQRRRLLGDQAAPDIRQAA